MMSLRKGFALVCLGCVTVLTGCTAMRGAGTQEPAPWVQAGMPRRKNDAPAVYYQQSGSSGAELSRGHEVARQELEPLPRRISTASGCDGAFADNKGHSDEARAWSCSERLQRI